ncbi:MAG: beta-propeller fold lactonase family protein [Acidobacteriota bacterium]
MKKTITATSLLFTSLAMGQSYNPDKLPGAVFVGTNHNNTTDDTTPPNQVAAYFRDTDGSLTLAGNFATGGQGSGPSKRFAGDGLGASHSVQLSEDHKWLFVTNAGSNDISVFKVNVNEGTTVQSLGARGLQLVDIAPTGDGSLNHRFPNSVTQHGNLVYVLNSADHGSIAGFKLSNKGRLTPLANSTRLLDAGQVFPPDTATNPAEVSFTPDGKHLVVTLKDGPAGAPDVKVTGPGRILIFSVDAKGLPSATYKENDLSNHGPFGFSFDDNGNLLTSLFVGGPNNTGGAGAFHINPDNTLTSIPDINAIGQSVPINQNVIANQQLDSCWLENNGKFAFTANYSTNNFTSYTIGADGSLKLLNAVAGTADKTSNKQGATPLDIRVSPGGGFLYDVLPGSGKVAAWKINADGTLTKIGEYNGLPVTVDGDAAPEERFGSGGSPAGIAVL